MFDITWIDRDASREDFRKIYRIMRKCGDRPSIKDDSVLAERADLKERITRNMEDGAICVVTSGRDCDCAEFVWSSIVHNPSVMKLWGEEQDAYYWADGPIGIGYCKPSERPGNYSRDLAMEAYENGHPHYVTSATV